MILVAEQNRINEFDDFWRYDIGVNVISADTKNKSTHEKWSEWQDKPIAEDLHNQWKEQDAFSKGIVIILGKVRHREDKNRLFLIFLDLDKQVAIKEFCTINTKNITLQQMAQITPLKMEIASLHPQPPPIGLMRDIQNDIQETRL